MTGKFRNNKRIQKMKPIDVIGIDIPSEAGRQQINAFVSGKTA